MYREDFVLGGFFAVRILCVSGAGGFCNWEDFVPDFDAASTY